MPSTLDVILVVGLGFFMYLGWQGGFVKQILSIIVLIIAIMLGTKSGADLGSTVFSFLGVSPGVKTVLGFIAIIGLAMLANILFYRFVLKDLVEGKWNSFGGMLIGIFEGGIIISLLLIFFGLYFNIPSPDAKLNSTLYKPMKNFAPMLYDEVNTILPDSEDFYQEIVNNFTKTSSKK